MPTKQKRQRSKKSSKNSKRRQSSKKTTSRKKKTTKSKSKARSRKRKAPRRIPRLISILFLLGMSGLGIMFGWAEYKVQMFLHSQSRGQFEVVGITGPLKDAKPVALPLLSSKEKDEVQVSLSLNDVAPEVVDAILTIEDRRFFDHFGVDFWAIGRAVVSNLTAGGVRQGASTLTQQLAKNLFLSPKRTIERKFQELFIALVLELHLTKTELLTLYLNDVYLGQDGRTPIHGIRAAAKSFFRKDPAALSVDEAALLAGLIKAPSTYNPRKHPKRATERRNTVLQSMALQGLITKEQSKEAKQKKVQVSPPLNTRRYAPFFEVALRKTLSSQVSLEAAQNRSAKVISGFSKELQQCGENAVRKGLSSLESNFSRLRSKKRRLEGGLVALDPTTGLVRAWVGGREYSRNQYDHVNQANRPIGSTVKPFIYLTALDPGLNSYRAATLRSILPDKPISVPLPNGKRWEPSNADKKFRGQVTLRYALEQSLNLPPIHVTKRVGIGAVRRTLQQFRVHSNPPAVLALSLGALETDLLSLTAGYGALANEGRYVPPRLFDRIEDSSGRLLYKEPFSEREIADPGAVFLLNDVLRGVVERGTAKRAKPAKKFPYIGGKTGTSQDGRDAWFIGFTPRLVAGIWVGFDDNHPVGVGGGRAAAPIWKTFFDCSTPYIETPAPLPPTQVRRVTIDAASGERFTDRCPSQNRVSELFLAGTDPEQKCALHSGVVSSKKVATPKKEKRQNEKRKKNFFERLFGM